MEERLCRKLLLNKILLTVTLSSYAKKKSFYMTLTATQTNCRRRINMLGDSFVRSGEFYVRKLESDNLHN